MAQSKARVMENVLSNRQSFLGVILFPHRFHGSEFQTRLAVGFGRGNSGSDKFLRLGGYMRFDLFP